MKINLTALLRVDNRLSPYFINKMNTDAGYLPEKDQTVKLSDRPYSFELEEEVE